MIVKQDRTILLSPSLLGKKTFLYLETWNTSWPTELKHLTLWAFSISYFSSSSFTLNSLVLPLCPKRLIVIHWLFYFLHIFLQYSQNFQTPPLCKPNHTFVFWHVSCSDGRISRSISKYLFAAGCIMSWLFFLHLSQYNRDMSHLI